MAVIATWDGVQIDPDALENYGWYNSTIVVNSVTYKVFYGHMVAHLREADSRIAATGGTLVGTSTTSASIGTGSKSLTVQASKGFTAGNVIIAYETGTPANYMIGTVDSYNSDTGALAFTVASGQTGGSGTITAWTVTISGLRGDTGAAGTVSAAADGDVSTPGIAWALDTNTGFYRTASGETSYSADGTRTFSIGSTGANLYDNTLQRPKLLDYGETLNAIGSIGGGTQDINLESGNVVTATVDTSETTFTFSNPSASGVACSFTLILTNGGSQTVNWPASVDWPEATAPTLTTSGVDILVFVTTDGGTTWRGAVAGQAFG